MKRVAFDPSWQESIKVSHHYDEVEIWGNKSNLGYTYAYEKRWRPTRRPTVSVPNGEKNAPLFSLRHGCPCCLTRGELGQLEQSVCAGERRCLGYGYPPAVPRASTTRLAVRRSRSAGRASCRCRSVSPGTLRRLERLSLSVPAHQLYVTRMSVHPVTAVPGGSI